MLLLWEENPWCYLEHLLRCACPGAGFISVTSRAAGTPLQLKDRIVEVSGFGHRAQCNTSHRVISTHAGEKEKK